MSATATAIDIRSFLAEFITQTSETYVSDLGHIPDDKLGACPMGVARTPLDFTAECAGFNMLVARVISGDTTPPRSPEERKAFIDSLNTREKAVDALRASVEKLSGVVSGLSDDDVAQTVTAPWGMEYPAYKLAHIAGMHMSYHDGQINYIQSLYGDAEVHW